MHDFIIWSIIVAILGAAITYMIIQKRNGVKCIGCPAGASCVDKPAQAQYKPLEIKPSYNDACKNANEILLQNPCVGKSNVSIF